MAKRASKSARTLNRAERASKATPARAAVVTRQTQPEPTKTGLVTYQPGPGDPETTVVFGKTFPAGKSVQIDDPRHYDKLSKNPQFSSGERKAAAEQTPDKNAETLDKQREKAGEEARKARENANAALAEAEAKERALLALQNLRSAETDPDRNPPITNHPVNA